MMMTKLPKNAGGTKPSKPSGGEASQSQKRVHTVLLNPEGARRSEPKPVSATKALSGKTAAPRPTNQEHYARLSAKIDQFEK